ncbi:hypothetical protein DSCW_35970 [Desulfosarcina widdelii]|uniref:Radical SAM core domain-containing protein n=1 Tax=Desulfosarcina widdelii TaxID=947919 RepID=A0A5K7Z615_9BACT|nr:radical SAM protein [Desulfosarcina widdelii]BBO76180.1 hypothetical protein DSCW_35970 [Desulfosarcina widdelii]
MDDTELSVKSSSTGSEETDIKEMLDGILETKPAQPLRPDKIENPDPAEEQIVNEAYEHLKGIFLRNFHNAMVEAGRYIIDNFYGGDSKAAFAKNKGKDQPPNLKALIDKIRQAPTADESGVPSIGWFYNAVNLAAHEDICAQQGLQTFVMLGHSHKLQLLHIPKLKSFQSDEFEEAVASAFVEKERLAKYAFDNSLSVRDFKNYIKEQHPSEGIDLAVLPPKAELRKIESKELVRLWNMAKAKYENGHRQVSLSKDAMQRLEIVLAETGSKQGTGKGRFQDWTNPKNNVNICTGCKNDCAYCYMKTMNVGRTTKKQPADWHNWELRQKDVDAKQRLRDGLVGFPSSHDIFPEILDTYLFVLGKLLRAGNEVLIVSKPRFDCIQAICEAGRFFTDRIIFRFTIGAMDDAVLKIFEPDAPSFEERKASLQYAYEAGFRTSVSMEPMLDTAHIDQLIGELHPFVNTDIWLGTMNHTNVIKKWADENLLKELVRIEENQSPEILTSIFNKFKNDLKIKWKTDAFKFIETALKQAKQG